MDEEMPYVMVCMEVRPDNVLLPLLAVHSPKPCTSLSLPHFPRYVEGLGGKVLH